MYLISFSISPQMSSESDIAYLCHVILPAILNIQYHNSIFKQPHPHGYLYDGLTVQVFNLS